MSAILFLGAKKPLIKTEFGINEVFSDVKYSDSIFFREGIAFDDENLENENIECVLMPYGTGFNSKFALPLESYLVYVRYKNLDYVRQILKDANL